MSSVASAGTLAEFLALPEQEPAIEYIDGTVVSKVPPKGKHSALQAALSQRLNGFAVPRTIAQAFPELRTTFGGRSTVPDLAVYRWNRVPVDEAGETANDFLEPPDIAIEIASPEQSVNGLVRRCLWYTSSGVAIALLVDPADHSILLFRANELPRVLRGDDRVDLDSVLPGFELKAGQLFAELRRG